MGPHLSQRLTVLLGVCLSLEAWAAPTPLEVVVWLATADDQALYQRIVGHSSDLDVHLIAVRAESREDKTLRKQLAAASRLAAAHRVRVVVWFDSGEGLRAPGGLVVYVAEPRAGRVLARRLHSGGAPGEHPLDSSVLEAAALVVRTALRGLAAGGEVGIAVRPAESAETQPQRDRLPAAVRAGPRTAREEVPPNEPADGWRPSYRFQAGWRISIDGQCSTGQQGPTIGALIKIKRLELGIEGFATLPSTIDDRLAALSLSHYGGNISAGVTLVEWRQLELRVGMRLGGLAFRRSTEPRDPALQATPTGWSPSLLAGLETAVRWAPALLGSRLALVVAVGVDYLPGAPELVYLDRGIPTATRRLWPAQPRAVLGLQYQPRP